MKHADSFTWRQVPGPPVTLGGANTATPTFTPALPLLVLPALPVLPTAVGSAGSADRCGFCRFCRFCRRPDRTAGPNPGTIRTISLVCSTGGVLLDAPITVTS